MDSQSLAPARARDGDVPSDSLRTKRDRMIHASVGSDFKAAFFHNVWPVLQGEYDAMMRSLKEFCENALKHEGIACQVSGRTKAVDSIQKSLDRRQRARGEQNPLESLSDIFDEIHDLVGLRIVLEFPDNMERALNFINSNFRQEKEPAIFVSDREVGRSWRAQFGAYQTRNYRLSLEPGRCETLSRFNDVMFEIQVTTIAEDLYNKLAHPLLYKGSPLTRQDEIVVDMAHGIALSYALCLAYMEDKLKRRASRIGDKDELVAATEEIARDGCRFRESLTKGVSFNVPVSPHVLPEELEIPLERCNSVDDLKRWLNGKMTDILNEIRSNSQTTRGTLENPLLTAEEEGWLRSLYTADYDSHRLSIPKPMSGTCTWFLEHPKYTSWRDVNRSSLLWVSGDPGCGKSVLSSFLVDNLTKNPPQGRIPERPASVPYAILYFFCDDKIREHRDASAIVRGILHQLVANQPALVRRHFEKGFKSRGTAAANELPTLWDLFLAVCQDKTCPPLIVIIDALDECEERSRALFLSRIAFFYSNMPMSSNGNWVKMLVTSRPEISIEDSLEALEEVRLKAEDETESISKDVVLVTQERLRVALRRFNSPANIVQGLTERLTRQAGHTFLWVSLMLQMIERSAEASEDALNQLLVDLPDELDGIYDKILARAQGRNRQKAGIVLRVVVAASRPLRLAELNFAISVRPGDTTTDDLRSRLEPNLGRTLQLLCGPFLKIMNNSTVTLVHQTAKEFLLRVEGSALTSTSWKHTLDFAECHLTIARACLLGLPRNRLVHHQEAPFADYAFEFWIIHLLECEEKLDDNLVNQVVAFFTATQTSPPDALRAVLPDSLAKWSYFPHTRLAFASLCGFRRIIERLLRDGDAINVKDGSGLAAIDFAALSGRASAVDVLLQHGANPAQRTLRLATNARSPDVVAALLRSGKLPGFIGDGRAQMMLATETGHEELTRLLEERRIRTDMRLNQAGDTPLIAVVKRGNLRQAEILAPRSLHLPDNMRRTALQWAAEYGHVAIARMLVANGARVDDRCTSGETPLLRAVKGRHFGVVRFLLDQRADATIPDNQNYTPLWWATINGDETSVRALLPVTRISDVQGPKGSLLWWARQNNQIRIAEILEAHQPQALPVRPLSTQAGLPDIGLNMCVAARVNGCYTRAIICTGAQATIIRESFARETGLIRLVDKRFEGWARGAGRGWIIGRVHLAEIQLGPDAGVTAPVAFTVLENKEREERKILLGLDFLKGNNCTVDFHQRKLVLPLMKTVVPMFEVAE